MEDLKQERKEFISDLITLAIPVGLQNMINSAVTMIDGIMVGSLGDASISAVNICWTYGWLFSTVTTAFASGALIMVSRMWVNNETGRIKRIMSFSIALNLILGLILFALTAIFPDIIIKIYSNVESVLPVGVRYLKIMNYSYLFNTLAVTLMVLLRAARVVKISLYTSAGSCIINVILNYLLIFGNFGFPEMGIEGAAVASLMARIFEFAVAFIYMFFIEKNLKLRVWEINPVIKKNDLVSIVTLTVPLLVLDFRASLISTIQTIITGHISEYYISANSIVHNSWEVPNIFCWGMMQAANVMIGNIIGNKEYEKAYRYSRYFSICAIIFGAFTSVILHFILALIIPFYNVEPQTLELAHQMAYSASFIVLFSSFYTITGDGVIKAGGNTSVLLKMDLLFSWLISIPAGAFCAFILHWPAYILYIVLRSNNIFKSAWVIWKLRKKDWIVNI